jgi:hypothetical protein
MYRPAGRCIRRPRADDLRALDAFIGRSDRGSSPWSRPPRSRTRTSAWRRCWHRPRRGPVAGSSSRRRDRPPCSPLGLARLPVAPLQHAFGGGLLPLRVHVEQVHEEVVAQRLGAVVNTPCLGLARRWHSARAGRRPAPSSRARSASAAAPCPPAARAPALEALARVVAEAVRGRLQHRERLHVGLLLRRVGAAGREGNRSRRGRPSSPPPRPRRSRRARSGRPARPSCRRTARAVELLLDRFQRSASTLASSAGWLTSQSFCGARRMRAPLAPPRLSLPRKVAADAQAVVTSWEMDRPEASSLAFSAAMSCVIDQRVIDGGHRVLPDQRFLGTSGPR